MTIQQVIDMAKYGELSTLSVKNDDVAIVSYINLGMLELYKRFSLRVEEHIIALEEGKTIYTMPDDFMWIVAAYEEVDEQNTVDKTAEIPVNKEEDEKSINTIGWNQVQIPLVTNGAYIAVMYVASPVEYTATALTETLALPPQMLTALLHYIAYKAHGAVDSGTQGEGDVHYVKYDKECANIMSKGMFNGDDLYMDDRVKSRGFV